MTTATAAAATTTTAVRYRWRLLRAGPLWLDGGRESTIDPGAISTWNGRIAPAFIGWRGSSTEHKGRVP